MKKAIHINISGLFFYLDQDAYDLLTLYMDQLNTHFSKSPEGKEIIADIENRIAEILQDKLSDNKQVISVDDISEVINIMGKPDDIDSEANLDDNVEAQAPTAGKKDYRRLYRDTDNRILGGVCAGIANFFNIDPLIVRLIFFLMLFFYGVIILIYAILWIFVPGAYSSAQKLEMKGRRFTVNDIEEKVRDEFHQVKDNLNKYKYSKNYKNASGIASNVFNAIGEIIRVFAKFIAVVIGIALLVAGIVLLIAPMVWLITNDAFIFTDLQPEISFSLMIEFFSQMMHPYLVWILLSLLGIILLMPVFALIYYGFKLIFGIRLNDRKISGVGVSVWVVAIVLFFVLAASQVGKFRKQAEVAQKYTLQVNNYDTLYLKSSQSLSVKHVTVFGEHIPLFFGEQSADRLFMMPCMDVEAQGQKSQAVVYTSARDKNPKLAAKRARQVDYSIQQQDSIIWIKPFFEINPNGNWHFPHVRLLLNIPENKIIHIEDEILWLINHRNADGHHLFNTRNRFWKVTKNGILPLENDTLMDVHHD